MDICHYLTDNDKNAIRDSKDYKEYTKSFINAGNRKQPYVQTILQVLAHLDTIKSNENEEFAIRFTSLKECGITDFNKHTCICERIVFLRLFNTESNLELVNIIFIKFKELLDKNIHNLK
jgi:hypothetical protein